MRPAPTFVVPMYAIAERPSGYLRGLFAVAMYTSLLLLRAVRATVNAGCVEVLTVSFLAMSV
jgi:hypothetical protein